MRGRDKSNPWKFVPDFAEVNGTPDGETLYGSLFARIGSHIHAGDGWDTVVAGFGNDTVWGEGDGDWLYGDTDQVLAGYGRGGIDNLYGGKGIDLLYGDAVVMSNYARGGNDWLDGQEDRDTLTGDAGEMRDWTQGGSDILLGGGGTAIRLSGTPPMRCPAIRSAAPIPSMERQEPTSSMATVITCSTTVSEATT